MICLLVFQRYWQLLWLLLFFLNFAHTEFALYFLIINPHLTILQLTWTRSTALNILEIFAMRVETLNKSRPAVGWQEVCMNYKKLPLHLLNRGSPKVQGLLKRGLLSSLPSFLLSGETLPFTTSWTACELNFRQTLAPSAGHLCARYKLCTQAWWSLTQMCLWKKREK